MSEKRMSILDEGIRFGPFNTEHHRDTVNAEFRTAFLRYVHERIIPMVTIAFTQVDGHLTTEYDERRFLGPNSAIKYRYDFKCSFILGDQKEEARAIVDYDPNEPSFSEPRWPASVLTLAEQARRQEHDRQLADVHRRIVDGEDPIACPQCGAPLTILAYDRKRLFRKKTRFVRHIECQAHKCLQVMYD